MEYLIGVVLAAAVCTFALLAGFDRDRGFYPTLLVVSATNHILFAVMGSSTPALTIESSAADAFLLLAVAGFKKILWLVVAGLAGHGIFDFLHHTLIRVARFLSVIRHPRSHLLGRAAGEACRIRAENAVRFPPLPQNHIPNRPCPLGK